MSIAIFGANGQIGRSTLREARNRGVECMAFSRGDLEQFATHPDELSSMLADCSRAINCAAFTDTAEAQRQFERLGPAQGEHWRANAIWPGLLSSACAASHVPLIHFSTDYVFDGRAKKPYAEIDQPQPINAYGASKWAGDQAVLHSGARAIILRAGTVFGPDNSTNFAAKIIKAALVPGAELRVDNQRTCSPIGSRQAALCALDATELLTRDHAGALLHISSGENISFFDFARRILSQAMEHSHFDSLRGALERLAPTQPDAQDAFERPRMSALDRSLSITLLPHANIGLDESIHDFTRHSPLLNPSIE